MTSYVHTLYIVGGILLFTLCYCKSLLQEDWWSILGFFQLVIEIRGKIQLGVKTYQVYQRQWTHRVVEAERHGVVNVFPASNARFEHANSVHDIRSGEASSDETRYVRGNDNGFS